MRTVGAISLAAAACLTGSVLLANPPVNADEPDSGEITAAAEREAERCEQTGLPSLSNGDEAREALRDTGLLKETAQDAGLGSRELRQSLKNDDSLHVDQCGELAYVEPIRLPTADDAPDTPLGDAMSEDVGTLAQESQNQDVLA